MNAGRILIVEDEKMLAWTLAQRLRKEGYETSQVSTGREALEALTQHDFELLLLDYGLPDADGIDVLKKALGAKPAALAILMTASGSVENAVEAMKAGAYDYLSKPLDLNHLVFIIRKALETTTLRREVEELRARLREQYGVANIIGNSPQMLEIFSLIRKVAPTNATVLLRGESGTGKGLLARAIHYQSARAEAPFVTITCSAIPETLLESELFGHERGAFTDARSEKRGQLELAHGGTVFMDEIGDMPMGLQAKLLRFLEDRTFKHVGGTRDIVVDVRFIAASNRNLEADAADGRFRADLYYRLNIVPIHIPPLRQRQADIQPLANAFIADFNREFKKRIRGIAPEAQEAMKRYPWPGNVRELRNMIERAVLLGTGHFLRREDLFPEGTMGREGEGARGRVAASPRHPVTPSPFCLPEGGVNLEQLEKEMVVQALAAAGGNRTKAARLLGMSRDQIRFRIKKFGLGT
jgi:DNA-binding NtrC family response regulator